MPTIYGRVQIRLFSKIMIFLFMVSLSLGAFAQEKKFQKWGFISNSEGERCYYNQLEKRTKYFHKNVNGLTAFITFEDPNCMSSERGIEFVNIMMINNLISSWYVGPIFRSDTRFKTREDELYATSPLQIKGKCMGSNYPLATIAIEYKFRDNSIVEVVHGRTAGDCIN